MQVLPVSKHASLYPVLQVDALVEDRQYLPLRKVLHSICVLFTLIIACLQ